MKTALWTLVQTITPVCLLLMCFARQALAVEVMFDIPRQRADRALTEFARHADLAVLFPFEEVSRITLNRLAGNYTAKEGLAILLEGTGLVGAIENGRQLVVQMASSGDMPEDRPGVFGAPVQPSAEARLGQQGGGIARLEEVTVTGSRIRRDDFNSATPTTVFDREYMEGLGIVNAGEAMMLVPANVNTASPTVGAAAATFGPGGNYYNGSTIANLRGLNPFFGSRTLTLVNSRRHVPTNQADSVDMNFIPTILIDRIEVVTGGASASYGSGAISGVTNVLLDVGLDGFRAEMDFADTVGGDGADRHVGLAFGDALSGQRRVVFGIEAQEMQPIRNCGRIRDWCGRAVGTIESPDFPADGGPQYVVRPGISEAWLSRDGLLWLPSLGGRELHSGSLVPGVQFTADGTGLTDWDPGRWGDELFATVAIRGDGQPIYDDHLVRTNVDRVTSYATYFGPLARNLDFFVEASLGSVESRVASSGPFGTNYHCMQPDYAFIQPEYTGGDTTIRDVVESQSGSQYPCVFGGVPIKKHWGDQVDYGNETTTELGRYAIGLAGRFGNSDWTWDAYYQHGESDRQQLVTGLHYVNRWLYGFDAVIDPTTGEPACRVDTVPGVTTPVAVANALNRDGILLADPRLAEGCVPINVIGGNTLTSEARSYGWGYIRENTDVEQANYEFVASGSLGRSLASGPVRVAAGFGYRSESIVNMGAEELGPLRTDLIFQYGDSFAGEVDVTEYFGELDAPLTDEFVLNLALRKSDYEHTAGAGTPRPGARYSHDFSTYRIGGGWQIVPALRFRFTQSSDLRAPNFRELYYSQKFVEGSLLGFFENPWTNNPMDPVSSAVYGNVELTPEHGRTNTVGIVVAPPASSYRVGIDYYEIEIGDAITPANLDLNRDLCFGGDQGACDRITGITTPWLDPAFDAEGNPVPGGASSIPCPATCFLDVQTQYAEAINHRSYKSTGIDFTLDWIKTLAAGRFELRVVGSRQLHQLVQPSTADPTLFRDIAGVTGNTVDFLSDWASAPDLTLNLVAVWHRGSFNLGGQIRWVSDGINAQDRIGPDADGYSPELPGSQNVNTVPSYKVLALSGAYDFELRGGNSIELYGVIENLLDQDPPLLGTGTGFLGTGTRSGTQAVFFDTLGRRFRVGVRMRF